VAPGWDPVACELWAAQRSGEAVTRVLASVQRANRANPALALQAAYYLFLTNDHRSGASVLEQQLNATPDHVPTILNLAVFYSRLGRAAESTDLCSRVLALESQNVAALDGLTSALYRLGRFDEASEAGTRVLEIKDRRCGKAAAMGWRLPKIAPRESAARSSCAPTTSRCGRSFAGASMSRTMLAQAARYRSQNAETPNVDQWFLRDRVWAFVRQSCLVHDRCFRPHGAEPLPAPAESDDRHIGQDESAARAAEQEHFLREWIEKYPCLGPLKF
jgi:tetratricopeptide (TPR) repeat protein